MSIETNNNNNNNNNHTNNTKESSRTIKSGTQLFSPQNNLYMNDYGNQEFQSIHMNKNRSSTTGNSNGGNGNNISNNMNDHRTVSAGGDPMYNKMSTMNSMFMGMSMSVNRSSSVGDSGQVSNTVPTNSSNTNNNNNNNNNINNRSKSSSTSSHSSGNGNVDNSNSIKHYYENFMNGGDTNIQPSGSLQAQHQLHHDSNSMSTIFVPPTLPTSSNSSPNTSAANLYTPTGHQQNNAFEMNNIPYMLDSNTSQNDPNILNYEYNQAQQSRAYFPNAVQYSYSSTTSYNNNNNNNNSNNEKDGIDVKTNGLNLLAHRGNNDMGGASRDAGGFRNPSLTRSTSTPPFDNSVSNVPSSSASHTYFNVFHENSMGPSTSRNRAGTDMETPSSVLNTSSTTPSARSDSTNNGCYFPYQASQNHSIQPSFPMFGSNSEHSLSQNLMYHHSTINTNTSLNNGGSMNTSGSSIMSSTPLTPSFGTHSFNDPNSETVNHNLNGNMSSMNSLGLVNSATGSNYINGSSKNLNKNQFQDTWNMNSNTSMNQLPSVLSNSAAASVNPLPPPSSSSSAYKNFGINGGLSSLAHHTAFNSKGPGNEHNTANHAHSNNHKSCNNHKHQGDNNAFVSNSAYNKSTGDSNNNGPVNSSIIPPAQPTFSGNGLQQNKSSGKYEANDELRALYKECGSKYFSSELSFAFVHKLKKMVDTEFVQLTSNNTGHTATDTKLNKFLKYLIDCNEQYGSNSITNPFVSNQGKKLVLVCLKNGKLELLSINKNLSGANVFKENDLVIIDGDRGNDLALILDAQLSFPLALLVNFLKKKIHFDSLITTLDNHVPNEKFIDSLLNKKQGPALKNYDIAELTQLIIPSKQVLRFATPVEITNSLFNKFQEELKALKFAQMKLKNLNNRQSSTTLDINILNAEYQFDRKKLTFYYICNKRNDFRELIKELFKYYKTRIWLCAIPNNLEIDSKYYTKTLNELNMIHHHNLSSSNNSSKHEKSPKSQPKNFCEVDLDNFQIGVYIELIEKLFS